MSDGTYTQAEWTMTAYIPYRDFAFTQMPLLPYVYGDVGLVARVDLLQRPSSVSYAISSHLLRKCSTCEGGPISHCGLAWPALYCA